MLKIEAFQVNSSRISYNNLTIISHQPTLETTSQTTSEDVDRDPKGGQLLNVIVYVDRAVPCNVVPLIFL